MPGTSTLIADAPVEFIGGFAVRRIDQVDAPAHTEAHTEAEAEAEDKGELLVLVHGLGGASNAWAPIVAELAAGHRLVLVDLPGHGRSPAVAGAAEMAPAVIGRRLVELCRTLTTDRPGGNEGGVHLVGHSLGGWVVLEAAAADTTGLVRSVTALTPAGLWHRARPRPPLLPTGQRLARASARLPSWVTASVPVRLLGFATTSAAPLALPLPLLRDAVEAIATAPGYADANIALAAGSFTAAADVHCPVTIVSASRDVVIPPAYLRPELAPAQTRWERLTRCGHVPAWDRPADCLRLIAETVARSGARRTRSAVPVAAS